MSNSERNSMKGFTLIELMVVVAIIGIISAIAYPSYQGSVTKTKRADAKSSLMDRAAAFERCFTMNGQYTSSAAVVGPPAVAAKTCSEVTTAAALSSTTSTKSYYTISISNLSGTAYLLTATPTGFTDTQCTSFTLDQTGVKHGYGTLGDACW